MSPTLLDLLFVYSSIFLINLTVFVLLWQGTKDGLYRDMGIAWLAAMLVLFATGLAEGQTFFLKMAAFSVCFFYYSGVARILAELVQVPFPRLFFLALLGASLLISAVVDFFRWPEYWGLVPTTIACGLPSIYGGGRALGSAWKRMSIIHRGAAVTVLLNGLHVLDYNVAYWRTDLVVAGFTIGIVLTIATTLFFPAAILERNARKTARLEADLAYRAQFTQASKLMALGEMAGGIAHEINTPLTVMSILASELGKRVEAEAFDKAALRLMTSRMSSTTHKISKIVSGLRAFAREGSGDPLQTSNLSQIIDDTLSLCTEKFRADGIDLRVELPSHEDLRILCRPVEISQVLLNLLLNAKDAVSGVNERWVTISARRLASRIEVSVTDSGQGISSDLRDKIFLPFFTTKELKGGTGLGLSISKGIAEAHSGTLTVDPDSAHTRFILSLAGVQSAD
jgi:signal transduction histidine kinase